MKRGRFQARRSFELVQANDKMRLLIVPHAVSIARIDDLRHAFVAFLGVICLEPLVSEAFSRER